MGFRGDAGRCGEGGGEGLGDVVGDEGGRGWWWTGGLFGEETHFRWRLNTWLAWLILLVCIGCLDS